METNELLVEPAISKIKYDREVALYRNSEEEYIKRGWWLLQANYPSVFIVFATPQIKHPTPSAIVFGVLIDFTNYDFWPPSVKLMDPFTKVPYHMNELPVPFLRKAGDQGQATALMQSYGQEDIPFFCIPGVREYHQNPAHTGDSWFLHRGKGEGTLYHIVNALYTYGVQPIKGYGVQLQIALAGFIQGAIPE